MSKQINPQIIQAFVEIAHALGATEFTIEWTGEDGERHTESAQEFDLCIWRAAIEESKESPIKMLLDCPNCKQRHIDEGEWATKPHKTHKCEHCGHQSRPDYRYTVGVASVEALLGIT